MNNKEITDHSLHLLVDDQLDPKSKKILKKKIAASSELQQKLKNITDIKELVALAYIQEKPKAFIEEENSNIIKASLFVAVAASMIMVIGLALGWFAHQQFQGQQYVVANAETRTDISTAQISLEENIANARKYMLHFDSMNENKFKSALIETSSILKSYAKSGLPVKVDLLFDQQAVQLFKPQYLNQIKQLKVLINEFDNIQFYACSESLKMFMADVELPSELQLFHSDQIVKDIIPQRVEKGWVYIKV